MKQKATLFSIIILLQFPWKYWYVLGLCIDGFHIKFHCCNCIRQSWQPYFQPCANPFYYKKCVFLTNSFSFWFFPFSSIKMADACSSLASASFCSNSLCCITFSTCCNKDTNISASVRENLSSGFVTNPYLYKRLMQLQWSMQNIWKYFQLYF